MKKCKCGKDISYPGKDCCDSSCRARNSDTCTIINCFNKGQGALCKHHFSKCSTYSWDAAKTYKLGVE